MTFDETYQILKKMKGPAPAFLSAVTSPGPRIRKTVTDSVVILSMDGPGESFYQAMRRETEPDFNAGSLAWGRKMPWTPLIENYGEWYIQTILVLTGDVTYEYKSKPVTKEYLSRLLPDEPSGAVILNTYKLSNLTSLILKSNP